MIKNMFSQQYGGVTSHKLHFYGNDGVCVFKYFVTPDDPQRAFTWVMLGVNFCCFLVISYCYLLIHYKSSASARSLSNNSQVGRRNKALQRKVTLIILTDFLCWVPFILVCGLHYLRVLDASPWYGTFTIVILPINSVINPLLYDGTVSGLVGRLIAPAASRVYRSRNTESSVVSKNEQMKLQSGVKIVTEHTV